MKIVNSTLLITGANRGLGAALVQCALEKGAKKVYAATRNPCTFTDDRIVNVILDVTDHEQIDTISSVITDVDILINNAGIISNTSFMSANSVQNARRELEVNYLGPLKMCNAFNKVNGIINIVSVGAWKSLPDIATYNASKAALWSLTKGIAHETKAHVLGVYMSFVKTDMSLNWHDKVEMLDPNQLASDILDSYSRGETELLADTITKHTKQNLSV